MGRRAGGTVRFDPLVAGLSTLSTGSIPLWITARALALTTAFGLTAVVGARLIPCRRVVSWWLLLALPGPLLVTAPIGWI